MSLRLVCRTVHIQQRPFKNQGAGSCSCQADISYRGDCGCSKFQVYP